MAGKEGDISELKNKIVQHLTRWENTKIDIGKPVDTLNINGVEVDQNCFFSYLAQYNESCGKDKSPIEKKSYFSDYKPKLAILIKEMRETDKNNKTFFDKYTEIYQNLYGFNIEMNQDLENAVKANKIPNEKFNIEYTKKLYSGYYEFVKQTLDYFYEYMDYYKLINDSLIKSNNDILEILNGLLKNQYVSISEQRDDLGNLYEKFVNNIEQNTLTYNEIREAIVKNPSHPMYPTTVAVDDLSGKLHRANKILKDEKIKLDAILKGVNDKKDFSKLIKEHPFGNK